MTSAPSLQPEIAPTSTVTPVPMIVWIALGLVLGASGLLHSQALLIAPLAALSIGFIAWAMALWRKWRAANAAALMLMAMVVGSWLPSTPTTGSGLVELRGTVDSARSFTFDQRLRLSAIEALSPSSWTPPMMVWMNTMISTPLRPGDQVVARGAIAFTGRTWQFDAVAVEVTPRESTAAGWAWQALARIRDHRPLAEDLLLGRGDAPEAADFRASGLLHLLAVSGMHLVLAAALGLWLLRTAGVGWAWRLAATATLVVGYTWLTGASPATLRACVMGLVLVLYDASARRPHPLGAVSLAAIAAVVIWPDMAGSRGFLLSLAAASGICTLGTALIRLRTQHLPLEPWPLDHRLWRGWLWSARAMLDGLAIGVAASLAVVPLIAWWYQVVNPLGPFATIIATVPTTLALWLGLPLMVLSGLWPEGPWGGLYALVELNLAALARVAQITAGLPGAVVSCGVPPVSVVLAWPLLFLRLDDRRALAWRGAALAVLILAWWWLR